MGLGLTGHLQRQLDGQHRATGMGMMEERRSSTVLTAVEAPSRKCFSPIVVSRPLFFVLAESSVTAYEYQVGVSFRCCERGKLVVGWGGMAMPMIVTRMIRSARGMGETGG